MLVVIETYFPVSHYIWVETVLSVLDYLEPKGKYFIFIKTCAELGLGGIVMVTG